VNLPIWVKYLVWVKFFDLSEISGLDKILDRVEITGGGGIIVSDPVWNKNGFRVKSW